MQPEQACLNPKGEFACEAKAERSFYPQGNTALNFSLFRFFCFKTKGNER
jgi:hypothetical protein